MLQIQFFQLPPSMTERPGVVAGAGSTRPDRAPWCAPIVKAGCRGWLRGRAHSRQPGHWSTASGCRYCQRASAAGWNSATWPASCSGSAAICWLASTHWRHGCRQRSCGRLPARRWLLTQMHGCGGQRPAALDASSCAVCHRRNVTNKFLNSIVEPIISFKEPIIVWEKFDFTSLKITNLYYCKKTLYPDI